MTQYTYSREQDQRHRQTPVYDHADEIPLERDIGHQYRARQARFDTGDREYGQSHGQSHGTSGLGALALAIGAGAALTWFATRSGSGEQRGSDQRNARYRQDLPRDETDELIASNKVEGTAVYDRSGEKIGTVHNFMVGKRSGRVAYAVVSFGGMLGLGENYHAVPWNALTYSEKQGGYVVPGDKERLRNAPSYQAGQDPFSTPAYSRQVSDYWLVVG